MTVDDDIEIRDHLSSRVTRGRIELEVRRSTRPALILGGLVAAALLVAGICLKNISGGSPLASRYTAQIAVRDASGIVPGPQEVRISGVPVGKIADVRLDRGTPILTLRIRSSFGPVFRDAEVRVRPQTPLQDSYVDIVDRGSPRAGRLARRDVLPATQVRTAVQLRDVLDVFDAPTRSRMQRFIDGFGDALGERGGERLRAAFVELSPFLRAAARLMQQSAERRVLVRRSVHNLRLMLDELARRDTAVRELVDDGARTVQTIAGRGTQLDAFLAELPRTLGQARRTFTRAAPVLQRAGSAFTALRPAAKAFPTALDSLRAFGDDATPAVRALRAPVRSLRPLLADARPLSADLAAAFATLRPTAPQLDDVTKQVEGCRLAVRQFFNWTASVFKFADRSTAFPRGEAVGDGPGQRAGKSCAPGEPADG